VDEGRNLLLGGVLRDSRQGGDGQYLVLICLQKK
jgi:hypothetical protein